jgi:hypothetical protein
VVFNSHMLNDTVIQVLYRFNCENGVAYKIFTFHKADTCVALPNACRCRGSMRALSFSVIRTIIHVDHKVQLFKPLNIHELYTT